MLNERTAVAQVEKGHATIRNLRDDRFVESEPGDSAFLLRHRCDHLTSGIVAVARLSILCVGSRSYVVVVRM